MAAKKKPDEVGYFLEILGRIGLTSLIQNNGMFYSKNDSFTTVIIPEQALLDQIIEDERTKPMISQLNPEDEAAKEMLSALSLADDIDGPSWIGIDADEIFQGKVVDLEINGLKYAVPVSRVLFPKMRKAEYNFLSYRVFLQPEPILALKKKWKGPNHCFTTIRPFIII